MIKEAMLMLGIIVSAGSYFQQNLDQVSVDVSELSSVIQAFDNDMKMDNLVAQSLHANDRRFQLVG